MIHPSDLLRSDSRSKQFVAPLHLESNVENDWGISIFPCLAKLFNWRTFAKPSTFVSILSLIGCYQGLLLYYFRNTSDLWSKHYNINKETSDWIIYLNEFFIGILAIPIGYWASITNKINWFSVLIIIHGVFSILLAIPEKFFVNLVSYPYSTVHFCGESHRIKDKDINYVAILIISIYQLVTAASSIGFYTIGLVYADDNCRKNRSIILAIALASKQFGQQLGIYTSWIPYYLKNRNVFGNMIWQGISVTYILIGVSIAMFPKILPSLLIKKLAASLCELARGNSMNEIEISSQSFFTRMKRLLTNKIILLTISSTVIMQSALINFNIFENYFKQSRFFISDNFNKNGYNSKFSLNFATNLLEQPLKLLLLLVTGFFISRSKIKMKYLVLWNVIMFAIGTLLFSTYLFIRCDYEKMTKLEPSCSFKCGCNLDGTFHPVCLKGRNYYSPCHAGCSSSEMIGNYKVFKNCSCAAFEGVVSDGSCNAEKCMMAYQFTQVNTVISTGLLATTFVTTIVILMSFTEKTEKFLSLSLEITMLSLIPFLPVKLIYHHIADTMCQNWYKGKCKVYSEKFSFFLSNSTVFLMITATVVQMFLLCTDLDSVHKKRAQNDDSGNSSQDEDEPEEIEPSNSLNLLETDL